MQAMERMDRKWNRGLNKKVKSEEKVPKSESKSSKQDRGRARFVASGWKPGGEEGKPARTKVQEKMDITLQASQDSRKPLKVQLRAQRPHYLGDMENVEKEKSTQDYKTDEVPQVQAEAPRETNCGHGDAKINPPIACLPLRGKKAWSQKWQDMILGWTPVVQDNMEKRCAPLSGKKACSQRWQNMVIQGTPAIQDKTRTQSPACDGEEEPVEGREQEMSLVKQTELPVPVEMSTESSLNWKMMTWRTKYKLKTEKGDVQGYFAEDKHLSPFVMDDYICTRLDDCNVASEDYTCIYYYYYYRLFSCFIIGLYFPH
ncbi:uncharacterized protein LOC125294239 [Alosa alosa]|uniref:uncharacterized protein LOC125294239 n=1 Tax=Alosa alosa TaxID=278164 RepID=UPI0020152845|nr:uncharacterized protein LOC125294239 [Alosa alosa]